MAAGRWTSQEARNTDFLSCSLRRRASLATVVVLPEPCSPATITTLGGAWRRLNSSQRSPMSVVSSSRTMRMRAWPGVRLCNTSCPTARARMCSMKPRTTGRATSASRNARRSSRRVPWMFSSLRRPWPRRSRTMRARRPVRLSNMDQDYRLGITPGGLLRRMDLRAPLVFSERGLYYILSVIMPALPPERS